MDRRVVTMQPWKGDTQTVSNFLDSVIQGCNEVEELKEKTTKPS